jgi:hypothetical protein
MGGMQNSSSSLISAKEIRQTKKSSRPRELTRQRPAGSIEATTKFVDDLSQTRWFPVNRRDFGMTETPFRRPKITRRQG